MIKIVSGSAIRFNGKLEIGANIIVRSLDEVKLPRDISEKLFRIAIHSQNKEWRTFASAFLTALADLSASTKSKIVNNRDNIREIVDLRYSSTLERKVNQKANRFRDPNLEKMLLENAKDVVLQHFELQVEK